MSKLREFVTIVVKAIVSGGIVWLAEQGINVPADIAVQVEAVLFFAALGAVNWVINVAAPYVYGIPFLGPFVEAVWPAPNYQTPAAIAYEERPPVV